MEIQSSQIVCFWESDIQTQEKSDQIGQKYNGNKKINKEKTAEWQLQATTLT